MLRIVIADDEYIMRDLLAKKITSMGGDYHVVGVAENGRQALDLIKKHRPEILVADICMPLMDGLELAEEAAKINKDIKTIIISGYDDFSYAKKAIGLGICDYILKPFLPDELFAVLDKVKNEIGNRTKLNTDLMKKQKIFDDNLFYLQERFLMKLVKNTGKDINFFESAEMFQVDLLEDLFTIGVLRFISEDEISSVDGLLIEGAWEYIVMHKDELFDSTIKNYYFHTDDNLPMALFSGNNPLVHFKAGIRTGFEKTNEQLRKRFGLKLYCVLGGIYDKKESIHRSYQEALKLWKSALEIGGILNFYEPGQSRKLTNQPDLAYCREQEEELLIQIETGDVKTALNTLDNILRHYADMLNMKYENYIFIMLIELVINISSALNRLSPDAQDPRQTELLARLKKHFLSCSLIDIRNIMRDYVAKCCELFSLLGRSHREKIFFTVKELIERHIGDEEFNLDTIASMVYFSPSYIRQIFRQISGKGFMEYLISRRMETAAKLLEKPGYKVQDVAEHTGYTNPHYFSICFKKYYNISPSDYRRRIAEKP
jgi:two-component system response regulator YesN